MRLYDPARPKVGDRPALLWEGKPVGAVPAISLFPEEDISARAKVCIVIAPSTGRWLEYVTQEPTLLLEEYKNDPEFILKACFGWSYKEHGKAISNSSRLGIGDLGELE